MSCDRVVVAGTSSQNGQSVVRWRSLAVPDLKKYLITFRQGSEVKNFDADAKSTSKTVTYTAASGCTVTVTPVNSAGPVNDKASVAVPVPFPPVPVDPDAGRPITLRACADATAGTVTVDWISSTLPDLVGYILTIFKGRARLDNFNVPDASLVATTVTYAIDPTQQYSVILTPYDELSPLKESASYPVAIPYPAPVSMRMRAYLSDPEHLTLKQAIRRR